MHRISSTSLSSFAFLALLLIATTAQARWCLPPVFDGGQRLQERFHRHSSWLAPAFRQHEVCWRKPATPGEVRVFLFGSSGPFGFPLPAEETLSGRLNERLADTTPAMHVFNFGYLNTYHIKDAVIAHESLAYQPDLIVFAITLDDFRELIDSNWTAALVDFFDKNHDAVEAIVREHPAGIGSELAQHAIDYAPKQGRILLRLRQLGRMLKSALRTNAETLTKAISREPDRAEPPWIPNEQIVKSRLNFKCKDVERDFEEQFQDWQRLNIIAWLESVERSTGIDVVVVNWPIARRPFRGCYNSRYTNAALSEYNRWMASETQARSIDYVDLHALLAPVDFYDSLHPTAAGHRKIAEYLEQPLLEIARRNRAARTARAAATSGSER